MMDAFNIQTLLLKTLAVLFVLFALTSGQKKKTRIMILAIAFLTIAVHLLRDGLAGLYFSFSGAAVATLMASPLQIRSDNLRAKIIYSAAAGSITGPIGSIFLFILMYIFLGMRILDRSGASGPTSYGRYIVPLQNMIVPESGLKSRIARIEIDRINRENGFITDPDNVIGSSGAAEVISRSWQITMAISTLAVMISGIFI